MVWGEKTRGRKKLETTNVLTSYALVFCKELSKSFSVLGVCVFLNRQTVLHLNSSG